MSHTFHEDEQRNIHFEEWDRALDDHLDTIHALNNGIDPTLDWVWDDLERTPFIAGLRQLIRELAEPIIELIEKVTPTLLEAWDKITTAAREAIQWITDVDWPDPEHREQSLVAPKRVDARRVTHTSTKPPAPARIYRRRTP